MGFKVVYNLQGTEEDVSASGSNFVALPYTLRPGLVTARDLFEDIGGSIQRISKHKKVDNEFEWYSMGGGTLPPNGWNLVPGESLFIKVGDSITYRTVGAHDPDLAIDLVGAATGISADGTNYVSPPINSVAHNARELFMEIGGSIQTISQHRKIDDTYEIYTNGGGTLPPNGWDIQRGEGYIIKVGGDIAWTPTHY